MNSDVQSQQVTSNKTNELRTATVRFVGDSGDGMQLVGERFTTAVASQGNDIATFPDFPAEIRAPAGTLYGVSGFQIQFGADDVYTPGDVPDVLVAMNPAALRTNLKDLRSGGLVIANASAFVEANLEKAGYSSNPLEDGSLAAYDVMAIDITRLTNLAVAPAGLGAKDAARCKNFWTLGLTYWLYSRSVDSTLKWIESAFRERPQFAAANALALKAGHAYGETSELYHHRYVVPAAKLPTGLYRSINGNTALAWGLVAAAQRAERRLVLGSYPITPATDVLQELSKLRQFGATTVQAEDEIAAVCMAIGASHAGSIGVTTTSGPGLALKMEAIGLAVTLELPLVVVDVQRAGPSTGMPTKTEQSDLLQAVYGRPGESPLCVLAASTPASCFDVAIEAVRIATKFMTPVIVLSDGALAHGAEPWKIPEFDKLPDLRTTRPAPTPGKFLPYERDPETLARAWVIPGQTGLEYRIGGLEKDALTGNVSSDPANHAQMSQLRAEKVERIAQDIAEAKVGFGPERGDLLVVGWGSSFGPIYEAARRASAKGVTVSHVHLTHLNPFPRNLGSVLAGFKRILVPELNLGQLATLLKARFDVPVESYHKMQGRPLTVSELEKWFVSFVSQ